MALPDVEEMLRTWHRSTEKLGFSYFRSGGGLMQTGRARILRVTPHLLTLDTRGSRLAVLLTGATFEFKPVGFLRPDLRGMDDVWGLAAWLKSQDWLFLFSDRYGSNLRRLTKQLKLTTGE